MAPHRSTVPVDRLTLDDLTALADSPAESVVSILMPTVRAGREVRQGPIRLANLLDEAEAALVARGADPDPILAPARALVDDGDAWQHQADGLALFADADRCRTWRVAVALEESVRVAPHPNLRPLLPLANGDERFAVLALSQQHLRLLDCTRDSVDVLDLPPGTPTSIEEALAHDDREKQLQVRLAGADRVGMFHGHAAEHDESEALARYFRAVDAGVAKVLRGTGLPLVLAAVEHHGPIYRQVTDHPDVLDAVVAGSPDHVADDELRAQAWPLVEVRAAERRRAALAAIDDQRGDGRVIEGVAQVALAAALGRAERIVVDRSATTWGRLDPDAGAVDVLDGPDGPPGTTVELHDAAVAHGLCTGATVLTARPGDLPAGAVASTRW